MEVLTEITEMCVTACLMRVNFILLCFCHNTDFLVNLTTVRLRFSAFYTISLFCALLIFFFLKISWTCFQTVLMAYRRSCAGNISNVCFMPLASFMAFTSTSKLDIRAMEADTRLFELIAEISACTCDVTAFSCRSFCTTEMCSSTALKVNKRQINCRIEQWKMDEKW